MTTKTTSLICSPFGKQAPIKVIQFIAIILIFPSCIAFPDYPPTTTCQTLYPHHGNNTAQSGPAPFALVASADSYTPGSLITLNIGGRATFRGFIVQARQADSTGPPYPIGGFNGPLPAYTQHIWCSGGEPGNTVGHNHSRGHEFHSVSLTWQAPDTSAGNITFWATVVQKFETIWVNIQSNTVTGQRSLPPAVPSQGPDFQITKSGCGETKSCFSEPAQCKDSGDCLLLVTYEDKGSDVIFEVSSPSGYGALGFNYKQEMDATDSITCSASSMGVPEVRRYYLDHHRPLRHDMRNSTDITPLKMSYTDGVVKCRFSLKKTPLGPRMRDLRTDWYMIFAWGKTSSTGVLAYHRTNATYTANKVNVTEPTVLTSGLSPTDKFVKLPSSNKKCVQIRGDIERWLLQDQGEYLMTYSVSGDTVTFEMSTKKGWAAVGFNNEKPRMDGTDAIICSRQGTGENVEVAHYKITGYSPPTKQTQNPAPLNALESEYKNGITYCKFSRAKQASGMMDLTDKVYLIFARGPVNAQGRIQQHDTREKSYTSDPVKITSLNQPKVSEGKDLTLIRAHAVLMSIAWLMCASLAMFVARYMKEVWGELFGLKAWFQVHRTLMACTLLFSIIGIILAFVYAEGWSETKLAHPLIGMFVLVLACVQPFMAFFRPKAGSERRFIFNWAHRSVGVIALLLAVVNCFLGMLLPHFKLEVLGVYPLIAYCVGVALVMVFEIVLLLKARSQSSTDLDATVEMKNEDVQVKTKPATKPAEQNKCAKKFMFGFLCLLVSGVTFGIIYLLATRPLDADK